MAVRWGSQSSRADAAAWRWGRGNQVGPALRGRRFGLDRCDREQSTGRVRGAIRWGRLHSLDGALRVPAQERARWNRRYAE